MPTEKQLQDFKKDLAELLAKHDARIIAMFERGDDSDIWNEGMGVWFPYSKNIMLCEGHILAPSDLTKKD